GFNGYVLPDMDEIADIAHGHYNNHVRGGEGHMEVGKFILNVLHNKSHMTLSVKPFGCMPSSGVSDGVQSLITAKYPQSLFCAIETSGDGKVNVQSRVQMFLFKARLAAQKEYADLLARHGLTHADVSEFFARHPRFASPLHRSPHGAGGTAGDRLEEIAGYVGKSPVAVRVQEAKTLAGRFVAAVKGAPGWVARMRTKLVTHGPDLVAQAREEWQVARPVLVESVRQKARVGYDRTVARFGTRPTTKSDAAAPAA
ncbi:MAG TPA: 2-hydroxyglutaryl-CoA dehydratase, partial [Polyangia bacterium]